MSRVGTTFVTLIARMLVRMLTAIGLLVLVALLIGRGQPPHDASILMRNPCELPCIYGITPGLTERQGVLAALQGMTPSDITALEQELLFTLRDDSLRSVHTMVGFRYLDGARVGWVRFYVLNGNVEFARLSDLLLAGWQPRRMLRSCEGLSPPRLIMSFGQDDRVIVELTLDMALTPTSAVTAFEIYAPHVSEFDSIARSACWLETTWQGFAALWKYRGG